jgi:hypothetical protein
VAQERPTLVFEQLLGPAEAGGAAGSEQNQGYWQIGFQVFRQNLQNGKIRN